MKSKASIKSHPLHPILIAFPIAFYFGTLLFDSLAVFFNDINYGITGKYTNIVAIIGAVTAAIPGFIDYLSVIPPHSSAKKRGATHGLLNVSVLVIFCLALYLKYTCIVNPYVILLLELAGVILTSVAGWLGGTLVYRNQIGVDIRYAGAGKWHEQYIDQKIGTIEVGSMDELKSNQMKLVHINGQRIVIAKTEHGYVAFDDRCSHKGGSLAGGAMICGTVQCPWHGSQFDVKTGDVKAGPAREKISTYAVKEQEGKVYLMI